MIGHSGNHFTYGMRVKVSSEECFENDTVEFLEGSYGEVLNKNHAEFIKLLAIKNNIHCANIKIDDNCNFFYFIGGDLFFCRTKMKYGYNFKELRIPMPPKRSNSVLFQNPIDSFEWFSPKNESNENIGNCDNECNARENLKWKIAFALGAAQNHVAFFNHDSRVNAAEDMLKDFIVTKAPN